MATSPFLDMLVNPVKVDAPPIVAAEPVPGIVIPTEIQIVPKPAPKKTTSTKSLKSIVRAAIPATPYGTLLTPKASRVAVTEIALPRPPPVRSAGSILKENNEMDEKRELLYKLDMMRRRNPTENVPEYSMQTEFTLLKSAYGTLIRKLTIDSTVETYRFYLLSGFKFVEIILSNTTKINMSGFSEYQEKSMPLYNNLLLELGEKNDPYGKMQLPVELRLGLLIVTSTVTFIVGRWYMPPELCGQVLGALGAMTGAGSAPKKMRGPADPPLV